MLSKCNPLSSSSKDIQWKVTGNWMMECILEMGKYFTSYCKLGIIFSKRLELLKKFLCFFWFLTFRFSTFTPSLSKQLTIFPTGPKIRASLQDPSFPGCVISLENIPQIDKFSILQTLHGDILQWWYFFLGRRQETRLTVVVCCWFLIKENFTSGGPCVMVTFYYDSARPEILSKWRKII